MKMLLAACVVVAGTLCAACSSGGSDEPAPAPTTTVTVSPAAAPAQSVDDYADAANTCQAVLNMQHVDAGGKAMAVYPVDEWRACLAEVVGQ